MTNSDLDADKDREMITLPSGTWYILPLRWLGPVSEMTYTVSSGTLNSTISYHTVGWEISGEVVQ